jgi:hypothetical protein
MIEISTADLSDASSRVVHLTAADDCRWSGVLVLGPDEIVELPAGARHDLLLLGGTVDDGTGQVLAHGDFAIRTGAVRLQAGSEGASLLAYRQALAGAGPEIEVTTARDARPWRQARTPGMTVASLSNDGHALSLVMWQPSARTRHHAHPGGEEIFVVRGMLCADGARYAAGSWFRLHPGAWHAPFVETPTLILVRNGHLHPRAVVASGRVLVVAADRGGSDVET